MPQRFYVTIDARRRGTLESYGWRLTSACHGTSSTASGDRRAMRRLPSDFLPEFDPTAVGPTLAYAEDDSLGCGSGETTT